MELKRFFRDDGIEIVIVPFSNNRRWCTIIFGDSENTRIGQIFETEKDAVSWTQNFINH